MCDECKRQHRACSLRQQFVNYELRILRVAERKKLATVEKRSFQEIEVPQKSPRKDEQPKSEPESALASVQQQKRKRSISPGSVTSSTAIVSEPLMKIGPPKKKKQKEPKTSSVTVKDQSTSDAATIKRLELQNSELRSQLDALKKETITLSSSEGKGNLLIECCSQLPPMLNDMKTRLNRLRHFIPKHQDGKSSEKGDADWNALKDHIEKLEALKLDSAGRSNHATALQAENKRTSRFTRVRIFITFTLELRHTREEDSKHLVILSGMLNNFVRTFANHGKTFGNHGLDTKAYTADLEHLQVLIDSTLERTSTSGTHWSVSALR